MAFSLAISSLSALSLIALASAASASFYSCSSLAAFAAAASASLLSFSSLSLYIFNNLSAFSFFFLAISANRYSSFSLATRSASWRAFSSANSSNFYLYVAVRSANSLSYLAFFSFASATAYLVYAVTFYSRWAFIYFSCSSINLLASSLAWSFGSTLGLLCPGGMLPVETDYFFLSKVDCLS